MLPRWCYLAGKALARSNRGLPKGRSPHQVGLFVSSANLGPAEKEPKANKEWTLKVGPFGLLKARLPCHITVGPLDPHEYPDSDKVFVALKGRDSNPEPASDLLLNYDEARKEVMILSDGVDGAASLDVRIPVKFDLDIKTSGNGSVKIEQMQCANCKIETEKGASILKSIKSEKIDIRAKGGDVTCLGTLQGHTDISVSQESNVNVEKLQGSSINVTSENGSLKAKYLYADSSFLTSAAGDILLGSAHGDITLETKTGSITVDSSEGSLKAFTHRGDIKAYVLRQTGEVNLVSEEGSIILKVPTTLRTSLKLSGTKVEVSPEIQLQDIETVSRDNRVTVTALLGSSRIPVQFAFSPCILNPGAENRSWKEKEKSVIITTEKKLFKPLDSSLNAGHMDQKDAKGNCIKAETKYGTVHLQSQTWFQSLKLKIP